MLRQIRDQSELSELQITDNPFLKAVERKTFSSRDSKLLYER